jgi:hypothetical protein
MLAKIETNGKEGSVTFYQAFIPGSPSAEPADGFA